MARSGFSLGCALQERDSITEQRRVCARTSEAVKVAPTGSSGDWNFFAGGVAFFVESGIIGVDAELMDSPLREAVSAILSPVGSAFSCIFSYSHPASISYAHDIKEMLNYLL